MNTRGFFAPPPNAAMKPSRLAPAGAADDAAVPVCTSLGLLLSVAGAAEDERRRRCTDLASCKNQNLIDLELRVRRMPRTGCKVS